MGRGDPRTSATPEPRTCVACGRRIEWRKKWERDWESVKYCSRSCRRAGVGARDTEIERAILDLLARRPAGATICPSEAARVVAGSDTTSGVASGAPSDEAWRRWMPDVRRAANRLAAAEAVVITQKGRTVDPSTARGAIRIRTA